MKQMSKQKLSRIKTTINILIAVFFIVTLTVASASACSSQSVKNSNSVYNNIPANSNPVNYENPSNMNPINYGSSINMNTINNGNLDNWF